MATPRSPKRRRLSEDENEPQEGLDRSSGKRDIPGSDYGSLSTPTRRSTRSRRSAARLDDLTLSPTSLRQSPRTRQRKAEPNGVSADLPATPTSDRVKRQQRRKGNRTTDIGNNEDEPITAEGLSGRATRSARRLESTPLAPLPNGTSSRKETLPNPADGRKSGRGQPKAFTDPPLHERRHSIQDDASDASEPTEDQPVADDRSTEDEHDGMDWLIDNIANAPEDLPPAPSTSGFMEPHESTSESFEALRRIALSKATRRRRIPLQHLSAERGKVHALLHATVTASEGNSMLLLGPHGAGKTALVEDVLAELNADPAVAQTFHVVKLDGLIQNEDNLALREIWRQLGSEMQLTDDAGGKSYADALASLLNVLFQSEDIARQASPDTQTTALTPSATKPKRKPDRKVNAIIFILSSFEVFAARPRQTLLYNLFDVAQARTAPIAVLGLSTRLDAADLLEKRVKSRFSHRSVLVPAARSLPAFLETVHAAVHVADDELSSAERQALSKAQIIEWNDAVDALLARPATAAALKSIYHTTKSVTEALTALLIPLHDLHHLPTTTHDPPATHALPTLQHPPTAPLHALHHLSTLSLALLIAAARLPLLHSSDANPTAPAAAPVNLALAYAEYKRLVSAARISGAAAAGGAVLARVFGRDVARGAWEALVRAGLVVPESGAAAAAVGETDMCRVEVALDEIEPASGVEGVLRRWCREL